MPLDNPVTGVPVVRTEPGWSTYIVLVTRRSRKTPTVHSETRLLLADLLDEAASSGMVCFRSEFEECTRYIQCGCSVGAVVSAHHFACLHCIFVQQAVSLVLQRSFTLC